MNRLGPQDFDRAKARLLEVVQAAGIQMARRGREYVGLCPFHDERTPSFTVNPAKRFFHCFGCGAHGDAADFLIRTQGGMDRIAALRQLSGALPEMRTPPLPAQWTARKAASPPAEPPNPVAVWASAEPVALEAGHPVVAYLSGARKVLPPWGAGLPEAVRWLPREAVAAIRPPLARLPADAAGCIVYAFTAPGGRIVALQLDALTADGRLPQGTTAKRRWRANIGSVVGAAFVAEAGDPRRVVLSEGPISGLAARWMNPGWRVLAAGPCANLAAGHKDFVRGAIHVVIERDGDDAGGKAAAACMAALARFGIPATCEPRSCAGQGDPADEWRERFGLHTASARHPEPASAAEVARRYAGIGWREHLDELLKESWVDELTPDELEAEAWRRILRHGHEHGADRAGQREGKHDA